MKLIRFLFSNLILITFFCVVIYAYYYWDNLTGEDTPAGNAITYLSKEFKVVGSFIEGIKTKQASSNQQVDNQPNSQDGNVEKLAVVMAESSGSQIISVDNIEPHAAQQDVFITPELEQSLEDAINEQAEKHVTIPMLSTGNTIDLQTQEDSVKVTPEDINRMTWIGARKAFYKRDYAASIAGYKQLISNSDNNFDAYGELGNVYFNQGKKSEAAAAYYDAAVILVNLGNEKRANSIIPLLKYLDVDKALQLTQLLEN